jgi:5-methylcytosine-specific restriction endonuclease McrA
MPATTHRVCPTCRLVLPANQLRQHRIDVHGLRHGSPPGWRRLRQTIIERDDGRCVVCGVTERLEVHHIDGNPKNDDPSNLETRCRKHNPRGEDATLSQPAGRFKL